MRSLGFALLAGVAACAVYVCCAVESGLRLLVSTTVVQRLQYDCLLACFWYYHTQTGSPLCHALRVALLESEMLDGKVTDPHEPFTDTSGPALTAPSDHSEVMERFHACDWKFVPPHLRDPVRLLRSFIEVNRARVEQAIWLAYHIPDLMDPKTMSQSKDFLALSHVVTPPKHPSLSTHLKDKRVVDTAYILFERPAYRIIYFANYMETTARLLDRVLMSMGKLPTPSHNHHSFDKRSPSIRFRQPRPMSFMDWMDEWGPCPYPKPDYDMYEGFLLGEGRAGIRLLCIAPNEPVILV